MIIYNVTTKTDPGIAAEWLQWLKEEHIAEMVATGCFTHATILELTDTDETDGPTYAVQYHSNSMALYDKYVSEYAPVIRQNVIKKWGDKIISFRTLMKVVH